LHSIEFLNCALAERAGAAQRGGLASTPRKEKTDGALSRGVISATELPAVVSPFLFPSYPIVFPDHNHVYPLL
jgi:hypothetical protein